MYNNSYNKQATVLQQKTDVVNRCITQNASLLVVPKRLNALSIAFQPYMDRNRAMPAALPRLVARCHPHTVVCAHTHTHMQMLKKHFPKNNKRQQTIDNKQTKKTQNHKQLTQVATQASHWELSILYFTNSKLLLCICLPIVCRVGRLTGANARASCPKCQATLRSPRRSSSDKDQEQQKAATAMQQLTAVG